MATYKVSYFPWKGNGEIIRLVLAIGETKYEDERLTMDEWLKVKNKSPTKHMPLLTVNGNVYGQTSACARYLARKFGLMGTNPEEELLIDEVFESVVDFLNEINKMFREPDEKRQAELKEKIYKELVPALDEYVKLRKGMFGENGFIIGKKISLADLHLYNAVDQCQAGYPDMFVAGPELQKHMKFVQADPRIQNWIKVMPPMRT